MLSKVNSIKNLLVVAIGSTYSLHDIGKIILNNVEGESNFSYEIVLNVPDGNFSPCALFI